MSTYYCHKCSRELNLVNPVQPPGQSETGVYQAEKFIKHTAAGSIFDTGINSIYDSNDFDEVHNGIVDTNASGCLEIDDYNRKNLIFYAGNKTGIQQNNGVFQSDCSGIKVVLSESESRIHSYPVDFKPESRTCARCGTPVPYDPR